MKVLLAPDKFKGSLTAAQVAGHLSIGLRSASGGIDLVSVPVADGGDGTLQAAVRAGFTHVPVRVRGPVGEPVDSGYARRGDTAVLELADACGLVRLPAGLPAPLTASSTGFGDLIRAALDDGCHTLVLAVGGSASTDGGAGMLTALGARMLDGAGNDVPPGLGSLPDIDRIDLTGLHPGIAAAQVVLACDVDNPLLGPTGAAAVYGPQKGVTDTPAAEAALTHFAVRLAHAQGIPGQEAGQIHPAAHAAGAGAAGGVGFAGNACLRARLRPGIDYLLDLTGFHRGLVDADLVITGEGRLDEQTLHGKAPAGVAAAARAAGIPVIAVAGRNDLTDELLTAAGFTAAYSLLDIEPDLTRCLAHPGPILEQLARQVIGRHHLPATPTGPAATHHTTTLENAS